MIASSEDIRELANSTTLKELILDQAFSQIKFNDQDAIAFANNKSLTYLDMSFNSIGSIGAKELAKNTFIKRLNIYGNKIDDEGAIAFSKNTTLDYLEIRSNLITEVGKKALAENHYIKHIFM